MSQEADALRVSVLGAGSWGTAMAMLMAKGMPTTLWARNVALAEEINTHHTNQRYCADIALPESLKACADIGAAVAQADIVLVAVPCAGFRKVLQAAAPNIAPHVPIISLSKGLEQKTGLRMTEIIGEVLPNHPRGVLTGPNLAREVIQDYATACVLAMKDDGLAESLAEVFQSRRFRVYTNNDLVGCEISGALKNVIAVACGMADGMQAGDNMRAALITRGLAEVTRLGVAMGGQEKSFAGLAGMGDLIATCTSMKSRNYQVGIRLGQGRSLEEIMGEMHMVAEGVHTSKMMLEMGQRCGVDLPIAKQVHLVLSGRMKPYQAFMGYLRFRPPASEKDPG